jgi:hypothetical protein
MPMIWRKALRGASEQTHLGNSIMSQRNSGISTKLDDKELSEQVGLLFDGNRQP